MNIGNGNKDLFSGDISHKTQRRRKLLLIEDILEDVRISLRVAAPSFLEDSRVVFWLDSLHPPMELVVLHHYPQSKQVSRCFVENEHQLAEQVPGTNPRWPRKY